MRFAIVAGRPGGKWAAGKRWRRRRRQATLSRARRQAAADPICTRAAFFYPAPGQTHRRRRRTTKRTLSRRRRAPIRAHTTRTTDTITSPHGKQLIIRLLLCIWYSFDVVLAVLTFGRSKRSQYHSRKSLHIIIVHKRDSLSPSPLRYLSHLYRFISLSRRCLEKKKKTDPYT